jgi:hypothetical protein
MSSSFTFVPLSQCRRRQASFLLRKALEKSCRTWLSVRLRRRLLLLSRLLYVPETALQTANLVFSYITFPGCHQGLHLLSGLGGHLSFAVL